MRTIKTIYRATKDGFAWKKGEVVAVDWDAYDAAVGYNLDTFSHFNVFETDCWEKIGFLDLDTLQKDRANKFNLIFV